MDEVQRFGEKRAFGEQYAGSADRECGAQIEIAAVLLGLIVREFTRRIRGVGQAGGAKGIRTAGTICPCLNGPSITIESLRRASHRRFYAAAFLLPLPRRFHERNF